MAVKLLWLVGCSPRITRALPRHDHRLIVIAAGLAALLPFLARVVG